MINVNKKNKTKNKIFEFLSVFSMTFGIVVGSGIYLKNAGDNGVLAKAGNNPYLAIAVWTLMAFFCCSMMLSFIELSSSTKKGEHNTLTAWAGRFLGRRYGSLVTILYAIIYLPVLIIIGALFTTSSFFQSINIIYEFSTGKESWLTGDTKIIVEIFVASLVLILFQIVNTYTTKPGKILQTALSFLKFIPLITVLIAGITFFSLGKESSFDPEKVGGFQINNIFLTMVPIMFAFDGFLDSAAIQKDCEHKEVVAPAMMTGIVAVSIFYIIISVAIFMGASDGNILNIFKREGIDPRIHFTFNLIITLTLLTMVNAYSVIYPIVIRASIEEKFVYSKKNGEELSKIKSSWISILIVFIFFIAFVGSSLLLPKSITGDDSYLYTAYLSSDSTIIIVYLFHIPLLVQMLINRKTKKIEVRKVRGAYCAAIFSSSMLILTLGYIYYLNIIKSLIDGQLISPIMWFVFIIILVGFWIINETIISKNNIEINDFYFRINPKNWFNYDKQKCLDIFNARKVLKNDKGKQSKQGKK
ncbi:APC family permease [Spiroplasma endosymbiont of Dioctria linearis]|uniref:APC family permease n=1 Tax=Spiroplasma endosymbiont of Dioctria linearis TaxID=3066290 RepID=UPI00313D37D5